MTAPRPRRYLALLPDGTHATIEAVSRAAALLTALELFPTTVRVVAAGEW